MALSNKVPIVPVGIYVDPARIRYTEVTAGCKSETARWYTSGPYALTVGEVIYLDGEVGDRAFVRTASRRVMQEIAYLARQSDRRIRKRACKRRARWFVPWPGVAGIGASGAPKRASITTMPLIMSATSMETTMARP